MLSRKSWRYQRVVIFVVAGLLIATLCSCTGKAEPKRMVFNITGATNLNNGQPVCLVIRSLTKKDFFIKGYDDIAGLVYADPQDDSMLAWRMIIPGEEQEIEIEQPEKGSLGVYSLFTDPKGNWRLMIEQPFEKKYEILIHQHDLEYRKGGGSVWPF